MDREILDLVHPFSLQKGFYNKIRILTYFSHVIQNAVILLFANNKPVYVSAANERMVYDALRSLDLFFLKKQELEK